MSTNTTQPAAAGLDLSALSGPWFMAEDRINALFARIRAMPNQRPAAYDDHDASPAAAVAGYAVKNGVARIDIRGVMTKYPMPEAWMDAWCGTCPTLPLIDALNRAMADWTVKGIVFVIDSPGGMVAGSNMLAEAIAAATRVKPCHAVVSDLAASAGYYVASQCDTIACNAMGEVGCIGVYTVLADMTKYYEDWGVKLHLVSSGGVKGLGADGTVSQELLDDRKRGVMAVYEKFIADVAAGRGFSIEQARQLGDGRCWIAPEALKLGLIDAVASPEDAVVAATLEVQRMNAEQFKAYAAANPDDAAVKALIESGYTKAAADLAPKAATIAELKALAGADSAFVLSQAEAQATLSQANAALCAKLTADLAAANKALADQAEAHKAALAAKDQEIERAKFEAGGQGAVGTGAAKGGESKSAAIDSIEDPKERAKAEWAANVGDCRNRYCSEKAYVGLRVAELRGSVHTTKAGK